jgi:Domain of unknown function (DUF4160)
MPIISAFFGIVIRMYYKEHEPAHFHAEYAGQQAKFTFEGRLIAGEIASAVPSGAFEPGLRCIAPNLRRIG